MMKRTMLGLAAAAFVALPSISHAQRRAASASAPIRFSMGAGIAMPMSDLGNGVGTGFHVEGLGERKLTGAPVFLRGELGFTMFGKKDIQGSGVKGSANSIAGMFDVGYNFVTATSVKPYLVGGLGMHHSSYTVDASSFPGGSKSTDSKNDLGVNVGGGMRFKMGSRQASLEARYIAAGDMKQLPIGLSVQF